MDETPIPTAAELGIGDAEYARILADVRRRQGGVEAPTPPATAQRRPRRLGLAVFGFFAMLALLTQLNGFDRGPQEAAYGFIQTNGTQPVTYASCRPILVSVYPATGPPDAEALVREAVTQLRSITGLDLIVSGSFGGSAPNWNFAAAPVLPDDPISVSWQDNDEIAELTDEVAGLGASRVMTGADGNPRFVAGTVALSSDYYEYLTERGDDSQALAVMLHEFGHVLGLAHVDSPKELMYDDNIGLDSFGPGDLEGLRLLGQGPCN